MICIWNLEHQDSVRIVFCILVCPDWQHACIPQYQVFWYSTRRGLITESNAAKQIVPVSWGRCCAVHYHTPPAQKKVVHKHPSVQATFWSATPPRTPRRKAAPDTPSAESSECARAAAPAWALTLLSEPRLPATRTAITSGPESQASASSVSVRWLVCQLAWCPTATMQVLGEDMPTPPPRTEVKVPSKLSHDHTDRSQLADTPDSKCYTRVSCQVPVSARAQGFSSAYTTGKLERSQQTNMNVDLKLRTWTVELSCRPSALPLPLSLTEVWRCRHTVGT